MSKQITSENINCLWNYITNKGRVIRSNTQNVRYLITNWIFAAQTFK